ncbi:unnamed protein product [Trifolium pratense]|uniref:Uncharacterized protein n=2 Tax=Trifolium pratense TaxID=57577 RepID=A0ACB0JGD1_TRIPR|nr:unnamed protein product [Trifolium pratense]CAJ2656965.1 unnamed protein product [Trifolium pratense]
MSVASAREVVTGLPSTIVNLIFSLQLRQEEIRRKRHSKLLARLMSHVRRFRHSCTKALLFLHDCYFPV